MILDRRILGSNFGFDERGIPNRGYAQFGSNANDKLRLAGQEQMARSAMQRGYQKGGLSGAADALRNSTGAMTDMSAQMAANQEAGVMDLQAYAQELRKKLSGLKGEKLQDEIKRMSAMKELA